MNVKKIIKENEQKVGSSWKLDIAILKEKKKKELKDKRA